MNGIGTQSIPSGYKQTEVGVIPGDWNVKQLSEIVLTFQHGRGLSKSDLSDYGPYKCIHYGELFTKYKELIKEVKSRTYKRTGYVLSVKNDVLIPTSDVTPKGLATASCIEESGIILGGGILVVRLQPEYDGLFLSYYIAQNKNSVLRLVKGSTVFHIYAGDLEKLLLSVPGTKTEQSAITSVLSETDILIENLEKIIAKKKAIKQGAMQELLTGKRRLSGFSGK